MDAVALTSDKPNETTGQYLAKMGELIQGSPLILITWECHRERLRERLGKAAPELKHVIFLEDMLDPVAAAEALERHLHIAEVRLINWINVPDTLTDTFIYCSESLGISIPFLRPYTRCRVKPLTRQILTLAGHSRIAHEVLSRGEIAPGPLRGPRICKPITGSGSEGVRVVTTRDELTGYSLKFGVSGERSYAIAGYRPREQFLIEDRLEGLEIEVDGYVHDGEVSVCALGYKHHEYDKHGFREVAGVTYFPHRLEHRRTRDIEIVEWVARAMTTLEFSGGVFHLEAMDLGDRIELIEINPRPGGGGVQEICERISGVTLATECMRLWLGLSPETKPACGTIYCISYCVVYPECPGWLAMIKPEQQCKIPLRGDCVTCTWKPLWKPRKEGGDPFKGDREEYLGEVHFVNQAFSPESLVATAALVRETLQQQGFWIIDPQLPDEG